MSKSNARMKLMNGDEKLTENKRKRKVYIYSKKKDILFGTERERERK